MNKVRTTSPLRGGFSVAVATTTALLVTAAGAVVVATNPSPARAHQQQQPGNTTPAATDPLVPALRLDKTPASEVAARLRKASGALVLTDRTVATTPVTLALASGSLSEALTRLAAALPAGTVVKTVLLPAPASGVVPDGDRVAALIAAQEDLYKPLLPQAAQNAAQNAAGGSALAPGEVQILGRRLAPEQAGPIVRTLGLRPVYLITNPKAAGDPIQKMAAGQMEALRTWMSMTPEQQAIAAEQQIDQLINMDSALRQQIFGQQAKVAEKMIAKIQGLPEGQRQQFLRDLTGGRFDGTQPPRPAPGTGGGQNRP